jgi:hypothetical protein
MRLFYMAAWSLFPAKILQRSKKIYVWNYTDCIVQIGSHLRNAPKVRKKMSKWILILFVLALVVVGCGGQAPQPASDSPQTYNTNARIPVDDNVYTISGQVVGDVASLSQQTTPAQGDVTGLAGRGYGYLGGSYFGPEFGGKGFVRLLIHSAQPETPLAPLEEIVVVKTTDTKASVLLPGDVVTFKCRAQYEAVAAVRENEPFNEDKLATWELDYCRMVTPVIDVRQP